MLVGWSSPFGGKTRTRVLLVLQLLGESYPREIARILDVSLWAVQQAIRSLELDGLVAGRSMGRSRVFQINPRYFACQDLQCYLQRLTEPEEDLRERIASVRRRPRRTSKPLVLPGMPMRSKRRVT